MIPECRNILPDVWKYIRLHSVQKGWKGLIFCIHNTAVLSLRFSLCGPVKWPRINIRFSDVISVPKCLPCYISPKCDEFVPILLQNIVSLHYYWKYYSWGPLHGQIVTVGLYYFSELLSFALSNTLLDLIPVWIARKSRHISHVRGLFWQVR